MASLVVTDLLHPTIAQHQQYCCGINRLQMKNNWFVVDVVEFTSFAKVCSGHISWLLVILVCGIF